MLRNISGIDHLSLIVYGIGSGATRPRFDLRQTAQRSAALLDSYSFFFAAPGVER